MTHSLYRTNSSPNLLDKRNWESQLDRYSYCNDDDDDQDEEFYVIGDRVLLDGHRAASVAYFGEVEFASGDWVGLVLDHQTGNHNGKVHGREYFQCAPFHGTFVRPHRLSRIGHQHHQRHQLHDSALGSSSSRATSRTATPLPTFQRLSSPTSASASLIKRSKSPAASSMGSYYYDDDYRQERAPSVASLSRRLKSIDESPPVARPSAGILKGHQHYTTTTSAERPQSCLSTTSSSSIGARAEELSRRIRAASASPSRANNNNHSSVFNFRPKREQLNTVEHIRSASQTPDGRRSVNLSSEPPKKGDRVLVRTERGADMTGILRFMGETKFATGEWAGVELDHPDGKNDGQVLGHRYFHCPKDYGLFVPAIRVRRATSTSAEPTASRDFGAVRSTIWSPPPVAPTRSHRHDFSASPISWSSSSPPLSSYSPSSSSAYSRSINARDNLSDYADPYNYRSPLTTMQTTHLSSRLDYADQVCRHGGRERPKFDDNDLEFQLKKSLSTRPGNITVARNKVTSRNIEPARPKAVKYTFTSSKYDGNPIARKTLVYD